MSRGSVIKIDGSPLKVIRVEISSFLPAKEYEYLKKVLEAYLFMRSGGRNNTKETAHNSILIVEDLIAYHRRAPWELTESDYNKWCHHLGKERKVAPNSERRYQGVIEDFYDFMCKDSVIKAQLKQNFGVTVEQIVFERIPHNNVNERQRTRSALTDVEINTMMEAINKKIAEAYAFSGKDLYPNMRDKALFYLTYACGLRASEVLGLNLGSFLPDPAVPEFGNYGLLIVDKGKGSRGSGRKRREVPIENPMIPPLMKWYIENVRGRFLVKAKIGEEALFLSQRGRRLSIASFDARFAEIMGWAGFPQKKFVPHCLRHSSVTHKSMGYSLKAVQYFHGHETAGSTEHYSHIPDEYIRKEMRKHTRRNIELYMEIKQSRDKEKNGEST
jgi:site-specific recombinase XerD